jgi:hypothetical protein
LTGTKLAHQTRAAVRTGFRKFSEKKFMHRALGAAARV